VHGRIAKLAKGFVGENVEHSKRTFARPWRHLGLQANRAAAEVVTAVDAAVAWLLPSTRPTRNGGRDGFDPARDHSAV
jgi:hypothetical protein